MKLKQVADNHSVKIVLLMLFFIFCMADINIYY